MNPYLEIILRTLAVYLFMVFSLRIFGKNQLSQLNAGDIILLLLISNVVENAMVGENNTLSGGLAAALSLFIVNSLLKKLKFKSKGFRKFMESKPILLVKDGEIDQKALEKAEISMEELEETVREHGLEKINEVKLAILEVDGNISIISSDKDNKTNYSQHQKLSQ